MLETRLRSGNAYVPVNARGGGGRTIDAGKMLINVGKFAIKRSRGTSTEWRPAGEELLATVRDRAVPGSSAISCSRHRLSP